MASASVIEKQNLEGDHSDAPMETEASSKNENKDDVVGRNGIAGSLTSDHDSTPVVSTLFPKVSHGVLL